MRFYFLLFIGAFAADMMTKTWIDQHPELAESELACTNGYIGVKPLDNSGFAGGKASKEPVMVRNAATAGFTFLMIKWLAELRGKKESALGKAGWALVLGGGLGNIVDRWARGSVRDFLTLPKAKTQRMRDIVFNTADVAIALGILLVGIGEIPRRK